MKKEINEGTKKLKKKKKFVKISKIVLLVLSLSLFLTYLVISIIYNSSSFTIRLDKNLYFAKSIVIYDDHDYKVFRTELSAETLSHLDNISSSWLPDDISDHDGGSHNGDNYIAYTFFAENTGEFTANYWTEIVVEEAIKGVSDAIRIRVYEDGDYKTYAKKAMNGEPEPDTVPFENDKRIALIKTENFKPNDIKKYTIVIWLEGNDPDCNDNILGGEIKISMNFQSEFIEE